METGREQVPTIEDDSRFKDILDNDSQATSSHEEIAERLEFEAGDDVIDPDAKLSSDNPSKNTSARRLIEELLWRAKQSRAMMCKLP